jgi:putative transposase
MSRADDPYDNACAESLWSRLKAELDMPKGGYESIEKLSEVAPKSGTHFCTS